MPTAKPDEISESANATENLLSIAELYPALNRREQAEAAYYLNRFLEVMDDIFQENQQEKAAKEKID